MQDDRGSKLVRQNKTHPYLLITAPTSVYGSSIIRYHSLECIIYQYPMAGWTAGVTAIFVRALVLMNGTCLGHGALVNFTTPIRGNNIVKTQFLGDIARFFETGRRFSNLSVSRGRSFCSSSNRLLSSMLVMFLSAIPLASRTCVFHMQPAKRTLRMSTFVLPVAEIASMCDKMVYRARLAYPIITSRGAISDAISDHVGKNRAKQEMTSDPGCSNDFARGPN